MTKSEATVLETDVVIFPMEFGQDNRETIVTEEQTAQLVIEKKSVEFDIETRFARLRKTLRKRSASIL